MGIFCSSFQMSTLDFFSKDLNCMLVPFSPEHSELAPLPLALWNLTVPWSFPVLTCYAGLKTRDCWQLIIPLPRRQIIPLCSCGNFSLSFLTSKASFPNFLCTSTTESFSVLIPVPCFPAVSSLGLLSVPSTGDILQHSGRTSLLSPLARLHTHLSLLPCKSCLTGTGALSKGHGMKWKSGFAASVTFILMCCLTKGLFCFAPRPCLLSRLGY